MYGDDIINCPGELEIQCPRHPKTPSTCEYEKCIELPGGKMHKHANVNTRKTTRLTTPSDFLRLHLVATRFQAALMNWMEVSTSLSKPEQFPHERLAEDLAHVKQLRLLVAGLL